MVTKMDYVYEKKAKLVGGIDETTLCLLNSQDDWIHDQYGESKIYHGTIYSFFKPFHPSSTSITGFFQDEETEQWIKVKNGIVTIDKNNTFSWKKELGELLTFTLSTGKHIKFNTH